MLKICDVILNKFAGETNPIRVSMIYKIDNEYVYTICKYKSNNELKINYGKFYKSDVKKYLGDKFVILGSIDLFKQINNFLEVV